MSSPEKESDVIEQEKQKTEVLRQALIAGESSGKSTPLDMEKVRRNAKKKVGLVA